MAIQAQLYSENFGFAFGGHQDLLIHENGCGIDSLCFVPQQQQFAPFDQFQSLNHQKSHGFLGDHNVTFLPKNTINDQGRSMGLSQSITAHVEKQRMEFEQFINLQNERLRIAMQEQRKHQTALLMKKYESKTQLLLKQKEEEIAKALTRTMELQHILKKMEIQNQTWHRAARENEAMMASLHGTIERLRETATDLSTNAADDAQSCCCDNREDENKKIMRKMVCKCCNTRNSCVIMLPCRHMCSCRDCEVFLDACPVCRMVKKGSIEAVVVI